MTPAEAREALGDNNSIRVRTRTGAEYQVFRDIIEVCGDDDYVYGTRTNGCISFKGRRRTDTRSQVRWFSLKNVTLVEEK